MLASKTIEIPFFVRPHLHDEWEYSSPRYGFNCEVAIVQEGIPSHGWERRLIRGMILQASCWKTGTLMEAPRWQYGLVNLDGTGDLLWVEEDAIAPLSLLHAYSAESEF